MGGKGYDVDAWIQTLKDDRACLSETDVRILCQKAKEILVEESNIQPVRTPVTICGDVHGQFFDVLELFRLGGEVPKTNYIFIGDFVDRGYHSVETFEYLLCLKLKYPNRITLLRGNHESRQITSVYGFYDEISRKYGNTNCWKMFMEVFDYLGIGALVDGSIFCVHGGLSPDIKTIDQIRQIDRKIEIPTIGPFCDLMWSDPENIEYWQQNQRGVGWIFGSKPTKHFCEINGIDLIARAHQLVQEGYMYSFEDENLVTVWSAPNYCYRMNNQASMFQVDENMERNFLIFQSAPESANSVNIKNVLPYFL